MRIIRHTQTQFAAEEKPLHWSGLFAVFAIASLVLLTEALTQGGGWQMVAAALFFAVSGYLLLGRPGLAGSRPGDQRRRHALRP